eukprot:CAMPEP_0182851450 /NCGR_PEP_ID=MMETSP0006_2-20121128/30633_1 /TAXON_ID=97485 /ORGANISM="Prymnesium parvum, Strain Texoma1" /LENGTH=92 /DNA_ID=CAMNT_0024982121 /DNA_START=305 /DNA_END=580 /DNA_ORIENTATION=+
MMYVHCSAKIVHLRFLEGHESFMYREVSLLFAESKEGVSCGSEFEIPRAATPSVRPSVPQEISNNPKIQSNRQKLYVISSKVQIPRAATPSV